MKIRKPSFANVEIGPLEHALRLPTASRISVGMKTICDACGKPITDEYFVGGFKAGHANMKLHEACADWCFTCDRPKSDCGCVESGGNY